MSMLLRWPLPALLSWAACWGVFIMLRLASMPLGGAFVLAAAVGAGLALPHRVRWRRLIVALGFPLSLVMAGLPSGFPAWTWLLPLLLLIFVYPRRAWGDAPLFPTPAGALEALAELAPLPAGARVLDAGCGLGHGLRELHRAYPQARLEGIEWSGLLSLLARWRCRAWALIRRGDMWAQGWQGFAMIYIFQRPESMGRVWAKAQQELAPDAWLVSLDFAIAGQEPQAMLPLGGGHSLWLYKPGKQTTASA